MKTKWIYLLCFQKRIGSKKHSASHYMGSAIDPFKRIREHWTGKSRVKISDAFFKKHIPFRVGYLAPGDKREERRLKDRHNHSKLCLYCRGKGD